MPGLGFMVHGKNDGGHVAFAVMRGHAVDVQRFVRGSEVLAGSFAEVLRHVGVAVAVGFDMDVHVDGYEVGNIHADSRFW